jgi:hypothetical protein
MNLPKAFFLIGFDHSDSFPPSGGSDSKYIYTSVLSRRPAEAEINTAIEVLGVPLGEIIPQGVFLHPYQ